MTAVDVVARLDGVVERWHACERCELRRLRRNVVVHDVDRYVPAADDAPFGPLLVLGEAPGEMEDRDGMPFVGPSGKLLRDEVLRPSGAGDVVIANVVCCRPPRNREPTDEEIDACVPHVDEIVEACEPWGVLLVGRTAEAAARRIPALRDLPQAHVTHPAFVLRNGWPKSKKAKDLVARAVGVVRRLVAKGKDGLGGASSSRVVAEGAEAEHEHAWKVVGRWERPVDRASVPLRVCATCGVAEEPGALPGEPTRRRKAG